MRFTAEPAGGGDDIDGATAGATTGGGEVIAGAGAGAMITGGGMLIMGGGDMLIVGGGDMLVVGGGDMLIGGDEGGVCATGGERSAGGALGGGPTWVAVGKQCSASQLVSQ